MEATNAIDHSAEWEAQYEFWTKIISDEVARLRINEGFEPIDIDLYELQQIHGQKHYRGKTRVCGRDFMCVADEIVDPNGQKLLRVSIRVQTRKHH